MIAFVTGATGFTGKAVVAELCARGIATVAHVRPDSKDLEKWQAHFAQAGAGVDTTPWQAEAMTATLRERGVGVVFCCIGTTQKRMSSAGRDANSYEAVDYGLPKLLAEAAASAGCTRFVYVSSLGAAENAGSPYLRWRWKAEEAIRQSGVPFTLARPSFITGDRDEARPAEALASRVADGLLHVVGALGAGRTAARYSSTDNVRLAKALVRLGLDPAMANQTVLSEDLK